MRRDLSIPLTSFILVNGKHTKRLLHFVAISLPLAGTVPPAMAVETPPGASACSGCHAIAAATVTPVPRLVGRKPADIIAAMAAFKSGQRPATVMDRIAKGFSDDEIRAIAEWYGAMKD